MGLLINTGLTTSDGGSVASGSYVRLETYFPMKGLTYYTTLSVWRDQAAYTNGLSTVKPIEIPQLNFGTELTVAEYTGITPTIVQNNAKAYLEQYVGNGNVEITWDF